MLGKRESARSHIVQPSRVPPEAESAVPSRGLWGGFPMRSSCDWRSEIETAACGAPAAYAGPGAARRAAGHGFMIEVVNGDATTTVLDGVRTIRFPAGQSSVTYDKPLDGANPNRLHTRRVSLLADDAVPVNYALAASGISGDIVIEPVGIQPDGRLAIGRAPGASGDYAVGEVLEVDTSGISDKGGLEYVYTSYEWIRTDLTTGVESIVQQGSSAPARSEPANSHERLPKIKAAGGGNRHRLGQALVRRSNSRGPRLLRDGAP